MERGKKTMIKMKIDKHETRLLVCIAISIFLFQQAFAQVDTTLKRINLTYKDYIGRVVNQNLDYAAEKYRVSIAKAQIEAAKVFLDPTIAFTWSGNRESVATNGYSLSTEIGKTFELGHKRKARVNLAKSQSLMSEALLKDYLTNLQADATIDYLTALKQNRLFEVMQSSYLLMKQLSDADSIRFRLGSIKAIDADQSKIEAGSIFNDLLQTEADQNESLLKLATQISKYNADSVVYPIAKLEKVNRIYAIDELITIALNNRADLLATKLDVTNNQNQLTLTRKERIADVDLKIGATNAYLGSGVYSAGQSEIYTGIAFPLKFSNFNKSEIKIAKFQLAQSEVVYNQAELKVKNEVTQKYNLYKSLCRQVDNYKTGLLDQAKSVLDGKIYSYSRGETSLLEVLNARRTYNDLQTSYYETLFNCNSALVELQRSVGILDIDF